MSPELDLQNIESHLSLVKTRLEVLIVDDSKVLRESLKICLAQIEKNLKYFNPYPFVSYEAKNGREALEIIEKFSINLIILDIFMPEMDGEEFLREIRSQDKKTKVIIHSSLKEKERRLNLRKLDADFIAKDLDPEEVEVILERRIEELLQVSVLADDLKKRHKEAFSTEKALVEGTIFSKTNAEGVITYVNDKFCNISGYTSAELIGKSHSIVRHPDTPKELYKEMWQTLTSGEDWTGVLKNRKKDGTPYYVGARIIPVLDEKGEITGYLSSRREITKEFQEQELWKQRAKKDTLTGLLNLASFEQILESLTETSSKTFEIFSLTYFDIDHFKKINDSYGHPVGDKVIQSVANVLEKDTKQNDSAYRIGGEEFAVILPHTNLKSALFVADRIREKVKKIEVVLDSGEKIKITISIGVTQYEKAETIDSLRKRADSALYDAKDSGRDRVESIPSRELVEALKDEYFRDFKVSDFERVPEKSEQASKKT